MSPFDNVLAVDQMEVAYSTLLGRPVASEDMPHATSHFALDGKEHPRIVTLVQSLPIHTRYEDAHVLTPIIDLAATIRLCYLSFEPCIRCMGRSR